MTSNFNAKGEPGPGSVSIVGLLLNLQPSGPTFSAPDFVAIFGPCPECADLTGFDIYVYADASGWVLAADANPPWIVTGSRQDHNETDPLHNRDQSYALLGCTGGVCLTRLGNADRDSKRWRGGRRMIHCHGTW